MKTMTVKKPETPEKTENRFAILAGILMGSGFFAPLLGLIFAIVHSTVVNDVVFSNVSTVFFIVSIPLLIVGSHFLDVHRTRWKMRRESEIQEKIDNWNKRI